MKELIKKILKEESEDLHYLDTYWKETNKRLDSIINKIITELPVMGSTKVNDVDSDSKIKTINYSDMDKWSTDGKSDSLMALANKIIHMIRTGKSDGIKRMLEKIATGRVKSLSKPRHFSDSEFLGRGHFRWNDSAIKLTQKEINRVKEFFKL
jgi:hypothetical protein